MSQNKQVATAIERARPRNFLAVRRPVAALQQRERWPGAGGPSVTGRRVSPPAVRLGRPYRAKPAHRPESTRSEPLI